MPSQTIRAIPPYAILDPERCSEFGRPVFAWHPQAGRVGVGGGGIAVNRGIIQARGAVGSGVTYSGGAVKFPGTATAAGAIDFGVVPSLQFANTQAFTIWHLWRPAAGAQDGVFVFGSSNGWGTGVGGSSEMICYFRVGGNSGKYSTGSAVTFNVWQSWFFTYVPGNTQFIARLNGGVPPLDGQFSVACTNPAYTSQHLTIGTDSSFAGPFSGLFGPVIIWPKGQAPTLAGMLDERPDLMWWWPGKSKGRSYFIPAAAVAPPVTTAQDIVYVGRRRDRVRCRSGIIYVGR